MEYDTTLKELFQTVPSALFSILVGSPVVELLNVEYTSVKARRVDMLARLPDDRLLHLELQTGSDSEMLWRMLEYCAILRRQFSRPVIQIVLYVGDAPVNMRNEIREEDLTYRYRLVDMSRIDAEPLLNSPSPADNLLAVLCRYGDPRELVRRVLRRIGRLPQEERRNWLTRLLPD